MDVMSTSDSLIIGYDCTHGKDKAVLIVGSKRKGRDVDIVNAFSGEEATELWTKLTTRKDGAANEVS